jgi:heptaprenyl diphosphate synthase
MKRKEVYENIFGAKSLFIAVLVVMPALLFNPSTEYRTLQFLFFWFLSWLSGKKANVFFTVLIVACIVSFNLIVPYGRVLFSFGAFKITSGALTAGVHRAVTLEALVMLSKAGIRQDLKIPGSFGKIMGESFRIFSVMMNGKYRITGKNLFVEIDKMMLELSGQEFSAPAAEERRTKPAGFVILVTVVILSWLPVVLAGTNCLSG